MWDIALTFTNSQKPNTRYAGYVKTKTKIGINKNWGYKFKNLCNKHWLWTSWWVGGGAWSRATSTQSLRSWLPLSYLWPLPLSHLHHIRHPWHQQLTRPYRTRLAFRGSPVNFRQFRRSGRSEGQCPHPGLVLSLIWRQFVHPLHSCPSPTQQSRGAGIVGSGT